MKRPLEYIAGGFVLGEVLALLPVAWMTGISAVTLAGVCYLWKKKGRSLLWWLLPVFAVLGMIWMKGDGRKAEGYRQTARSVEGETIKLWGDIKGIQENKDSKRLTLELKRVELECEGKRIPYGNVLAYVDSQDVERDDGKETLTLRIGMRVMTRGELESFEEPGNPGEFDYGSYYHSLGIEGRFLGERLMMEHNRYSPFFDGIYRIKVCAGGVLDSVCSEHDSGIFKAMVLGEKSELAPEIRKLYQSSGIAHLLAISGLHISMIGMGAYRACRKLGMGFGGAGFTGGVITVCYGIMAGGTGISASVVRAVTMVLMQLLADFLGRTYDMRTAAGVSAMLLLLESPGLLFQAGFQLSFGAVLALGIAVPFAEEWMKVCSVPGKALTAGAVIQIITCPVIVYHYFEYPVYGIVLNFMVIPLMSYVLLSGILGIAGGLVLRELGILAVGTGHYVLEFYQRLCEMIQGIPGAVFITGRPALRQIAAYAFLWCGMLAVMAAGTERDKRRNDKDQNLMEEGESHRERRKRRIAFMALTAVGLWLLFFRVPVRGLEVTFLDVGQGDGICIQSKDVVILVDGGSSDKRKLGERVLIPFLKSQGISRVDYAVVSHGDQDHISGLGELLKGEGKISVSCLVLPWPGQNSGDDIYKELEMMEKEQGGRTAWMKRGDYMESGSLQVRCLYTGEKETGDRNDHSLLLEVRYGLAGILLTGDMTGKGEGEWLAKGDQVRIQILKAAHHGSGTSTGKEFLACVAPDFAVISCGKNNRYGHPSPATLERLEAEGIAYYITAEKGAIKVKTDGEKIDISTFR